MEAILKIVIGLFLLALSLSYLYRPSLVLKVNALARDLLFSDVFLLHYRRRWGIFTFAASVLFLYSGVRNLGQTAVESESSGYDEMNAAYRHFYLGRYDDSIRLTKQILRDHPGDSHAHFLLKQAQQGKARVVALSTKTANSHQ